MIRNLVTLHLFRSGSIQLLGNYVSFFVNRLFHLANNLFFNMLSSQTIPTVYNIHFSVKNITVKIAIFNHGPDEKTYYRLAMQIL